MVGSRFGHDAAFAAGHDAAESVARLDDEKPDRPRGIEREPVFRRTSGAERHARRRIDDEPHLEFMVGDRVVDLRFVRARGGRPVDESHVVAVGVAAYVAQLRTRAVQKTGVVTVQQTRDAPCHRDQ